MARHRGRLLVGMLLACTAGAGALADDAIAPPPHARHDERLLAGLDPASGTVDRRLLARALGSAGARPARPATSRRYGIGDLAARPDEFVLRVGPQVVRPVRSEDPLDSGAWQAGLASVAIAVEGVRMYGALASDRCALAGEVDDGASANGFLIQPFLNYNLADGWYLASVPVIRADWTAASGQKWTVPMGASVGRLARLGDMPLSVQAGYYHNVERPDGASDWALNLQVRLTITP